jgi:hypothetical protein
MVERRGKFHTCTTIVVPDIVHFVFVKETLALLRVRIPRLFFVRREVFNNLLEDIKQIVIRAQEYRSF